MDEIRLAFTYSKAEYAQVWRQYYKTSAVRDRSFFVLAGFLLVGALVCWFAGRYGLVLISLGVAVLVLVAVPLLTWYLPGRNAKHRHLFRQSYGISFSPQGVRFNPMDTAATAWDVFYACLESADFYFMLHARDAGFTALPKRAFVGAEQRRNFGEMCIRLGCW